MARLPSGWIPERPLEEDIENLQVDVLSARCAADRLRLKTNVGKVAVATSEENLEKMLIDLRTVLAFVADVARVKAGLPKK